MVEIATRTVAFLDFVLGSVSFSSHRVFLFVPTAAIACSITGSHFLDYRSPCEWVQKGFVRSVHVLGVQLNVAQNYYQRISLRASLICYRK